MLVKNITYNDYNGVERTEAFRFNLTKAEIMELELGTDGGYAEMIQKIIDSKDSPSLMRIFKEFILKAYGEKSDDGRRFVKSEANSKAFSETEAYSQLFMELCTDAKAAADFVNGLVPTDLAVENNPVPVPIPTRP